MLSLTNRSSRLRALAGLIAVLGFAAHGADVSYYGVLKSMQTLQTNSGNAPVVLSSNGYSFTAIAVASTNNVLTNATVKPGAGALRALAPTTNNTFWIYTQSFNSQSALDSAYPAGTAFNQTTNTMTLSTTNDGIHSASLTFFFFFTALSYPAPAQLTNLTAAQAIDTTADFTLGWNGLGGSSLTIVELSILDASSNVLFLSPAPLTTGALTGTSTSTVIPAYTLPPGANLIGHLTIGNPSVPDTTDYSGATGVAALTTDTQFPLTTRPAPMPPRLTLPSPLASKPQVYLTGETDRIYHLLASPNLVTWTNLFTTNCPNGSFRFTDTNSTKASPRYYRAKVGQ